MSPRTYFPAPSSPSPAPSSSSSASTRQPLPLGLSLAAGFGSRSRTASSDSDSSLDTAYEEALSFFQGVASDAAAANAAAVSSSAMSSGPGALSQQSHQSWTSSQTPSSARRSSASSQWTASSVGTSYTDWSPLDGPVEHVKRAAGRESVSLDELAWGSQAILDKLEQSVPASAQAQGFAHNPTPAVQPDERWDKFNFPAPPVPEDDRPSVTGPKLSSSTSNATIRAQSGRDRVRRQSFTKTALAELDIDAILEAYALSWADELNTNAAFNSSQESLGQVLTPQQSNFPSPPSHPTSTPSSAPRVLNSAASTRSLSARSPVAREARVVPNSGVPYAEVFPSIKRTPKSAARAQSSQRFPFPPPPIPAAHQTPNYLGSVHNSPVSPAPSSRGSMASIVSHSSYASTSPGSFRWSVNTASTAPTMDEDWSPLKRGTSRAGSSIRSSVASSAFGSSPPKARHAPASARREDEDDSGCDWRAFARELDSMEVPPTAGSSHSGRSRHGGHSRRPSLATTEEGDESEALSAKQIKQLRKVASSKSIAASLHKSDSSASLSRKMSSISLKRLAGANSSSATLARPPIPHRSASLAKSLAEQQHKQALTFA